MPKLERPNRRAERGGAKWAVHGGAVGRKPVRMTPPNAQHQTPGTTSQAPPPGSDESNRQADEAWLGTVIEKLDRQRGLFRELDALSEQQSVCVKAGDTDRLLNILSHKQGLIDRIQGLSSELQAVGQDWAARIAELPERSRLLIKSRTDELDAIAASIRSRDDADRASLEVQRGVIAEELSGTVRTRGAVGAYARSAAGREMAGPSPRYQDRRG